MNYESRENPVAHGECQIELNDWVGWCDKTRTAPEFVACLQLHRQLWTDLFFLNAVLAPHRILKHMEHIWLASKTNTT